MCTAQVAGRIHSEKLQPAARRGGDRTRARGRCPPALQWSEGSRGWIRSGGPSVISASGGGYGKDRAVVWSGEAT
ncbi:hypothetical protein E2562_031603 [Oryza meyeriana var. granulata]|uniref:Uncharacterized protein n=1 Tax=Oryza meyeriana var. granulata TaxID=110450 RepID=A0A6G1CK49_9ORYZ|nr:hypothetical protein E2562_031603 [Oryza meyeriana var. granulata]